MIEARRTHETMSAHQSRDKGDVLESLTSRQEEIFAQIPEQVEYVDDEMFSRPEAEEILFEQSSTSIDVPLWSPMANAEENIRLAKKMSISQEQQRVLFLQLNYARYRLNQLVQEFSVHRSQALAKEMVRWQARALKARSNLVRANIALVYAMAKRTRITGVEFTELVSEGNMALLRSVEKFNVSRGCRFSTYACRSILKSFSRVAKKAQRLSKNLPTQVTPNLDYHDLCTDMHRLRWEESLDTLREILRDNQARLTDVERVIVTERFALERGGKGRTLAEIASIVGLTNERVRQLQIAALCKIRNTMEKYLPTPSHRYA